MKNFYKIFKKAIHNNQKKFRYFTALFLMFFFITYIGNALNNQSVLTPENPIKGIAENSSQVALASHDEPLVEIEEINEETSEEEMEEENLEDNEKGTKNNDDKKNENKGNNKKDGPESDEINPESSHIEIVNSKDADKKSDKSKINEYFTTNIVHNEIVTDEDYSFVIKQKDHGLTVKKTEVFLNNSLIKDFKGEVTLEEGINAIKIKVTYEDDDGKVLTVSKTYTVYLNTDDIIIYSNLNDGMKVTKADLFFTASAKKGGKDLPVDVHLNEEKVKEESKNYYDVTLDEGENQILISASDDSGNTEEKSYLITYEKKDTKLKIITDLKSYQEVTEAKFNFNAVAKFGEDKAKLTVENNGNPVSGNDKGNYSLTLVEGENNILLKASHGEETVTETYQVMYEILPGGGDEDWVDPKKPIIETDLKDGTTVKSSKKDIYVKATDYKGNRIRANQMRVVCNGAGVGDTWDDGTQTSYELPIKNGVNQVLISAWDSEGRRTKEEFYIEGIVKEEGDVIGTATISIEATTVGIGYIIPPTKVEIRQGEPASYVVDRLLKENGFDYKHTGRFDDSFYLASIKKEGILSNPSIPEDLATILQEEKEKKKLEYDPTNYSTGSLGEFSFTNLSGWMFSVNGHYTNYGLADVNLLDGDVLRFRYTLALGKDIGGSEAIGDDGGNWHKEW